MPIGNELADLLARQGSSKKCDKVYPEVPVPMSVVNKNINDNFLAKWQTRFSGMESLRQTKNIFSTIDGRKIKKLAQRSRQNLNLLIQVGTGHTLLAHHTGKWTEMEDKCKLCLEG